MYFNLNWEDRAMLLVQCKHRTGITIMFYSTPPFYFILFFKLQGEIYVNKELKKQEMVCSLCLCTGGGFGEVVTSWWRHVVTSCGDVMRWRHVVTSCVILTLSLYWCRLWWHFGWSPLCGRSRWWRHCRLGRWRHCCRVRWNWGWCCGVYSCSSRGCGLRCRDWRETWNKTHLEKVNQMWFVELFSIFALIHPLAVL